MSDPDTDDCSSVLSSIELSRVNELIILSTGIEVGLSILDDIIVPSINL